MIRIDLVDNTAKLKHVDFRVVPVTTAQDFTCTPDGVLSLGSVVRISRDLKAGRVFGQMGRYLWYRLAGSPDGQHKGPLINC
ncbi:MAG: hypothetical protein ABSG86_27465 [Thermoguttaceae bacterium]|jgi:hypothetical protein